MYSKILVRFGELSTKGKNKMTFVRQLAKNIKTLTGEKSEILIDRIFLDYKPELIDGLQKVFGIYSYSPVYSIPTDIDEINKKIIEIAKNVDAKTFKIQARRNWKKFEHNSNELNRSLGGLVLSNSDMKVDVKNPDLTIEVEVRQNETYIFIKRIRGLGGLPVGINGNTLHLMSGGIDSPIAALKMMKRGIHVDYLNFITPPHTDEKTISKVNRLVEVLNQYQGKSAIYRINYTDLMNYIGLISKQAYKINLMRRSFYRIAYKIAQDRNYLALSNGENLGQVASQTIESIHTIASPINMPIFRPLLSADKQETIDYAKKMGTYDISIEKGAESCELFAPKAPVTKPTIEMAEKLEAELPKLHQMEDEAIKNLEIVKIHLT